MSEIKKIDIVCHAQDLKGNPIDRSTREWSNQFQTGQVAKNGSFHPSASEDVIIAQINEYHDCASIGIADGVGGQWQFGIDPRQFANELVLGLHNNYVYLLEQPQEIWPSCVGTYLFNRAYQDAVTSQVKGSSTLISGWIDRKANTIDVALIGDCRCVIYRPSPTTCQLIRQTHGVTLGPRWPKQFGDKNSATSHSELRATPAEAEYRHFELEVNDYVLMGSDGLFDNLYDETIADLLFRHGIQKAVPELISEAFYASRKKHSTPYEDASDGSHIGGKEDDISVVLYQHR